MVIAEASPFGTLKYSIYIQNNGLNMMCGRETYKDPFLAY